jgi:hypothetical protein
MIPQLPARLAAASAALACFLLAPAISARTWHIQADGSGDALTIQAGIDSAVTADTVLVAPGTYLESIDFRGKGIVVTSEQGPEVTVLDGTSGEESVVCFQSGERRAAILEGFLITGGKRGVLVVNSEPSILGNIIRENGPDDYPGGGIRCIGDVACWVPLVANNTIQSNTAKIVGGGIASSSHMAPVIEGNEILENEAGSVGGGIFLSPYEGGALVQGNRIAGNHAGHTGGGIWVDRRGTFGVTVSWNLIQDNIAVGDALTDDSGGGLWLSGDGVWIHHNTIVGNGAESILDADGGGVAIHGSPVLEQNIIALSGLGGGISCNAFASPTIRNNLAWDNLGAHGAGSCSDWPQSDGNIVTDPYFCDPASGDYSVAQNSPAMTHVAGPLGAIPIPGCGPVAVEQTTWGRIKAMYD